MALRSCGSKFTGGGLALLRAPMILDLAASADSSGLSTAAHLSVRRRTCVSVGTYTSPAH